MTEPTRTKDGEADLAILYPDRAASIAGVELIMREYSFAETLQQAAPIAALTDLMVGVAVDGKLQDLDSLRVAFGTQWNAVLGLIALACNQPVSWVADLNARDGEQLFLLWWGVNADFFLTRVLLGVQLRKVRDIGGPTSTRPSSAPDTGPVISPGTRTVN